jgi:hypothetical protein
MYEQYGPCLNMVVSPYINSPASREWTSIIEAVFLLGGFTRPTVGSRDTACEASLSHSDTPDWRHTTLEIGWITDGKGIFWLLDIFVPETQLQGRHY